jgi:Coenzyme PQQ synthesis protein D (PqqD)
MKASKEKDGKSALSRGDALLCRPVKNPEIIAIQAETGDVLLTYPVTLRPWLARIYKRFGKSSDVTRFKKLQLDRLGTEVWEMINGRSTVERMVERFGKKHRLHPKEAEVAVTGFLRDLGKRGLIAMK